MAALLDLIGVPYVGSGVFAGAAAMDKQTTTNNDAGWNGFDYFGVWYKDDPNYNGAVLFATHCSGCHTLSAAGTQGSGNRGQRTQGPNLNQRTETYEDALYAIQNGGFSGAIMPQNIVVGKEAEEVAKFVAKCAGEEAEESPRPTAEESSGGAGEESSGAASESP